MPRSAHAAAPVGGDLRSRLDDCTHGRAGAVSIAAAYAPSSVVETTTSRPATSMMPGLSLPAKTSGRSFAQVRLRRGLGNEPDSLPRQVCRCLQSQVVGALLEVQHEANRRSSRKPYSVAGPVTSERLRSSATASVTHSRAIAPSISSRVPSREPPASVCSSTMTTRAPERAAVRGAASPAGPARRRGGRSGRRPPRSGAWSGVGEFAWPGRPRAISLSDSSTMVAVSVGSGNGVSTWTSALGSSAPAAHDASRPTELDARRDLIHTVGEQCVRQGVAAQTLVLLTVEGEGTGAG